MGGDPYGNVYGSAANAAYQSAAQQTTVETFVPPEQRICDLVRSDLGVSLNHQAVRMFIRARWARLSKAAHEIHDA